MVRMQYATITAAAIVLTAGVSWADPPAKIAPTFERLPTYWGCQDDLSRRVTVTFLSTEPPTAIITRDDTRVTATLQESASGSKYMAPGGAMFWIKGKEATIQWPPARTSFRCANLAG